MSFKYREVSFAAKISDRVRDLFEYAQLSVIRQQLRDRAGPLDVAVAEMPPSGLRTLPWSSLLIPRRRPYLENGKVMYDSLT